MLRKKFLLILAIFLVILVSAMSFQCTVRGEAPTIELEVYNGPEYNESDNACYYRIEAIAEGDPQPEISFGDDSNVRQISAGRVEVSVEVGETYELTATATNENGSATATFTLSGQCSEEEAEEEVEEAEETEKEAAIEEEEEEEEEEEATTTTTTPKSAPKISLAIVHGPEYSSLDGICFYRIKASVTGSPKPTITFSKDDSAGSWGKDIVQVNLDNPADAYNLTATATNSEGSDTDSISITWDCEIPAEEHTVELHPSISGTVSSAAATTAWIAFGDSPANIDWRGLFAFDVSSLAGKDIVDAQLKLADPTYYGTCDFKGDIMIGYYDFLPGIDASDWSGVSSYGTPEFFAYNAEPLEFSTSFLIEKVEQRANSGTNLQFIITYQLPATGGAPGVPEGREYYPEDITLTVTYIE